MKTLTYSLLPLAALAAFAAGGVAPDPQFDEPPLRFELRVGGQEVVVRDGVPFELTLDGTKHRAEVRALPTRLLQLKSLQFEYPTRMGFEYGEIDAGTHLWTLDGNDIILMLFSYPRGAAGENVVDEYFVSIAASFDLEEVPSKPLSLGDRKVGGKAMRFSIGGFELEQEGFTLVHGEEVFLLIVQDSLTDDEFEHTAEWYEVRELLESTFRFLD